MPKNKTSITARIINFFTFHPWLKIIALILAVGLWLYVKYEITNAGLLNIK